MHLRLMAVLVLVLLGHVAQAGAQERPPYRVFAFGDSYGSGEGAPGTLGSYGSDGTQPDPRASWSGTAADRAFTGDAENGLRGARRCHRSPRATAAVASRLLQVRFPEVAVVYRSLACSGARIDVGVLGPFKGLEGADGNAVDAGVSPKVPSQLSQANDLLDALPAGQRRVDALVMNIGGNNLGFSDIIRRCVSLPRIPDDASPIDPCSPPSYSSNGAGNNSANRVFTHGDGSGEDEASIGLDDIVGHYAKLDDAIDGRSAAELRVRPRDVVLSGPPAVLAGGFGGCAGLTGPFDYENRLRADERGWLNAAVVPGFVSAVQTGASDSGWTFVNMLGAFTNGICASSTRSINRNRDALPGQGAVIAAALGINVSAGFVHPNAAGFEAMGARMATTLEPLLISRFTPRTTPAAASPVELDELAARVELRVTHGSTEFPQRAAATLPGRPLQAGEIGELVTLAVPGDGSLTDTTIPARSCGPMAPVDGVPRGCHPNFARDVRILAGTPGRPTIDSATRQSDGLLRLRWTRSPGTTPLRRFVVSVLRDQPRLDGPNLAANALCGMVDLGPRGSLPEPTSQGSLTGDGPSGGSLNSGSCAQPLVQRDLPPARTSLSPSLSEANVSVPSGSSFSLQECTDRGCGAAATGQVSASTPFTVPGLVPLQLSSSPLGLVSARVAPSVRRGERSSFFVGWRAWKGWKDLRSVDVQLSDRRGRLATLRLDPRNGGLVLRGRGGPTRRGAVKGRRALASGPLRLDTRRVRMARVPATAAFELPLTFARRGARAGPIEVHVGATSRTGKKQAPAQAARLVLR